VRTTTLRVTFGPVEAGEGRRLRPLTEGVPKAMLDIGGVPLAARAQSAEEARQAVLEAAGKLAVTA
jgi:choline kinase